MAQTVVTVYKADVDEYLSNLNKAEQANRDVEDAEEGVEKQGKKSFTNVAKESKKVENAVDGIGKRLKTLAVGFVAAFSIQRIIGGAIQTISGFQQQLAGLGSITGLTGDALTELGDKGIEISQIFGTSSEDILKGFQLVGSAKPELLENADALAEVTLQAEILGKAAGSDLPAAAGVLTKALNQFGAGADEAAMFVDILATSQQKGTATANQLGEALVNGGSTANAFKLSFEETNAILQGFAAGGTVGAEAGTQLSGVLSKLAKTDIKEFNTAQTNAIDVIQNLADAQLSYTDLLELTDDEGAKWLSTLIAQNDTVQALNGNLFESGNALEQANQNTNTLVGSQDKMNATYDAFILSLDSGEGAISGFLRTAIDGFTEFLQLLIAIEEQGVFAGLAGADPQTQAFKANVDEILRLAGEGEENFNKAITAIQNESQALLAQYNDAVEAGDGVLASAIENRLNILNDAANQLKSQAFNALDEVLPVVEETAEEANSALNSHSEEQKKLLEKQAEEALKLQDEIRQARIDLIADEGEQAIAQLEFNFEKETRTLDENITDQAELIRLLEEKKNQDILDLQNKAEEERLKNEEEFRDVLLNKEQEALELLFKTNNLFIEQTVSDEDEADALRLKNKERFLKEQIELAEEFGEETIDLELELAEVQNEIQQNQTDLMQEQMERRIELQRNLLSASLELVQTIGNENIAAAKAAAVAQIAIAKGEAIAQLVRDAQAVGVTPIEKALIFATGLIQIGTGIAQARQALEGFKEGVVDYQGIGTGTSDSNVVRISKGESIIKADATKKHTEELHAMNDGTFDDFVHKRYVMPMLQEAIKEKTKEEKRDFAENIADSLKLTAALSDGNILRSMKQGRQQDRDLHNALVKAITGSSHLGKRKRL